VRGIHTWLPAYKYSGNQFWFHPGTVYISQNLTTLQVSTYAWITILSIQIGIIPQYFTWLLCAPHTLPLRHPDMALFAAPGLFHNRPVRFHKFNLRCILEYYNILSLMPLPQFVLAMPTQIISGDLIMNLAKNTTAIALLSVGNIIGSTALAQTTGCEAGNLHHSYTPPAWVAEMHKMHPQPAFQHPGYPMNVNPMPGPRFPAHRSFAPAVNQPAPVAPAWNRSYPGGYYSPWNYSSNRGSMDNMMDGFGNGDGRMNFGFGGNMSGRGYGNGRNSYQGSWWDAPLLPIYAPAETAPKTESVTKSEPVATPPKKDDDKDGVFNLSDLCVNTPAGTKVNAFGCAEKAAMILRGVNFHTNSDELTDTSVDILDRVVNTLKSHPEVKLEVSGHTDSRGDDAYNKDLSERRAISVRRYLVEHGVIADNLTAKGYGEERPIASNDSKEGMAQNRRVELNRLDR
jgi:outer membrane protein OmpA-like peptidoglycan-associated protein